MIKPLNFSPFISFVFSLFPVHGKYNNRKDKGQQQPSLSSSTRTTSEKGKSTGKKKEEEEDLAASLPSLALSPSSSSSTAVKKREDYISWDDYFMGVAFLSAMRSKDPSTQVGACLVDQENKIVGIGKHVGRWVYRIRGCG